MLGTSSNGQLHFIPPTLSHVSAADKGQAIMEEVSFRSNAITGSLPPLLVEMPVMVLDLGDNLITGTLPASLGASLFLRELFLDHNQFQGTLSPRFIRYSS